MFQQKLLGNRPIFIRASKMWYCKKNGASTSVFGRACTALKKNCAMPTMPEKIMST